MATYQKTRNRYGKVEHLYGGYVSWINRQQQREVREVQVWGPKEWDPSLFGDGREIMDAVEAKAQKRWKKAICNECWRY